MNLAGLAEKRNEHFIGLRRALHANAQTAFNEQYATALIKSELESMGIETLPNGDKTGVIGILKGCLPGGTIALRADIDALPITEESGEPFASVNGSCHACGHDIHTSALLMCASLLSEYKNSLKGTVRFLFQPAEEGMHGAKTMIAAGALDDPAPDAILAEHCWPNLPAGTIGYIRGPMMAASDRFSITVRAPGAHAAYPHKSADPVVVLAEIIVQLQTIVSRELDPLKSAVVTIGKVEAGTAANIIPSSARLEGTVRSFDRAVRDRIRESIARIARCTAEALNASAETEYREGASPVVNNDDVISSVVKAAGALLGEDKVVPLPAPSMGGEDFAYYLEKVPGAMFRIGTADERPQSQLALHSQRIVFNEQAIRTGAVVMTGTAFLLSGSDFGMLLKDN